MSELIQKNDNRATIRWKLLTGASAMALTAYVASTALARADDDSDRPTLWIELGGQMEIMNGLSNTPPITAPFMFQDPVPEVFQGVSISGSQHAPRLAFGEEGKISFQPEDSDWIFSAGIRFGRSHSNRHIHHQTPGLPGVYYTYPSHQPYATFPLSNAAFLDITVPSNERHMLLDFSVGKDVGLGLLGRDGSSTLSAGARFLDVSESMTATIFARPNVVVHHPGPKYKYPRETFNAYTMTAHADRSFKGAGPSISWNASAALAGNKQDGELRVDWSVNAAMLFGRQKAKSDHTTQANQQYLHYSSYYGYQLGYSSGYTTLYGPRHHNNPLRSRKVTVPNIGGSVGLSVKYPNIKFSIGYRYDTFLNAMDTGLDVAKKSNLTFQGPYASISIGLGD